MLMYMMLRRWARDASLPRCRVNDAQRKQRSRLTIGLGMTVMIFILLCTVACGGSDGSLAKGGINMVVVSGQAKIQSGGGNTRVVKDQEAVITAGDQIMADETTGVKLLLADGSLLYLSPDTDLQLVTFSPEGTARLKSQLKGRLEVEAASPLLTVEISISVSVRFAAKTIQFTVTPTERDTTFQLWFDGVDAHLTVEAGEVNITQDDRTATIPAGGEVTAAPGEELALVEPTTTAVPTADLTPTMTPDLSHPSPTATATPTATPNYLYLPPGLVGPADGDNFKPNDDILLMWDTPTPLAEDEWYEVQLWREGVLPEVVQWVKEGTWKVEPQYYPGRYLWRILIVRGQDGRKEMNLSPPSQTWGFGWLSPPAPVPTAAPTSPSIIGATPVLTIYLLGTNNAQGFATFPGEEHVDAGMIYIEGRYVYGNVAVQIGDTVYHSDEELASEPKPLPALYRLEVEFSKSLLDATESSKAGFLPQEAQFWVGELDCNSAAPPDEPYKIEMILYEGEKLRKRTEISFLVKDAPLCGGIGPEEDEEESGPWEPPR